MTPQEGNNLGYTSCRTLPTGEIAGLMVNMFTTGLVILDEDGLNGRWCFEGYQEAFRALAAWDGQGDPPGNWIKQKLPIERLNPNWSKR